MHNFASCRNTRKERLELILRRLSKITSQSNTKQKRLERAEVMTNTHFDSGLSLVMLWVFFVVFHGHRTMSSHITLPGGIFLCMWRGLWPGLHTVCSLTGSAKHFCDDFGAMPYVGLYTGDMEEAAAAADFRLSRTRVKCSLFAFANGCYFYAIPAK